MSGIDLLCRLLSAYEFSLPLDQVVDDPGFDVLQGLKLVERRSSGGTVLCHACDLMHTARVAVDPVTDILGWRCPDGGFVAASPEQTKSVRTLPGVLVSCVADALGCRRRLVRPLIDGILWRIGTFEIAQNDVTVYLAPRLRDVEDARAIAAAIAVGRGCTR